MSKPPTTPTTVSKEIHYESVSERIHLPDEPTMLTRLEQIEQRLGPEPQPLVKVKRNNGYPDAIRQTQVRRFLDILEECGNPGTAADMVGINMRTIYRWRLHNASFSKKYDESLKIGEYNIEHQLTGKMDSEALSKPFDKVTSILAMFRTKKLNPQYKDTQQVNVNVAGPAALQFVIGESSTASPQPDTTTGGRKTRLENA